MQQIDPRFLVAIDASVLLVPKWTGWRWAINRHISSFPYNVDLDFERLIWSLNEHANVALLCDMDAKHVMQLEDPNILMARTFRYRVLCRSADEYALFMESYTPHLVFSNLPSKFQTPALGAIPYLDKAKLPEIISTYISI